MKRIFLLAAAVILALSGCNRQTKDYFSASGDDGTVSLAEDESNPQSRQPEHAQITVYVCGAVQKSGVYTLPEGSRVVDAIAAAGGLSDEADPVRTNQARLLSDGEQILVYEYRKETDGEGDPSDGVININQADAQQLQVLPGVGASKATAIVSYREEHGFFQTPEEITNVSGIGPGLYERIKEQITVG